MYCDEDKMEFMKWDSADGRYKVGLSAAQTKDSTLSYTNDTDVYDSLIYIGIIDTFYKVQLLTVQRSRSYSGKMYRTFILQ